MENKRILNIALLALIFSFASFAQSGIGTTISSNIYNYYNYSNSSTDDTKINKTGDDISGAFYNGTSVQLTGWDIRKDRFYLYNINNSILRNYYQMNPYGHFFYGNLNISGNFSAHNVLINSTETNISGNLKLMSLSPLSLVCSDSQRILGSCGISESDPIAMSQGFVTNSTMSGDNTKVNKSGDNMTGKLVLVSGQKLTGIDLNYSRQTIYNGTTRSYQYWKYGIESWFLNNAVTDVGWLEYTTVGAAPPFSNSAGFGIRLSPYGNNTNMTRFVWYPEGFLIQQLNSTSGYTGSLFFNRTDGSLSIDRLSGSGNAYACVSSEGKIYRGTPAC